MGNRETAFITGASYGIGRELALLFAENGHDLVLLARNEVPLQAVASEIRSRFNCEVLVISKDISHQEAVVQVIDEIEAAGIRIDYLVNNAGFGLYGEFIHTEAGSELNMIDLNVKTVTHFTKYFLPKMIEHGRGGVLNIASVASFQPGPLMAVYYATKAYVLSFTEALANELQGKHVLVTALCPGPTATHFSARAELGQSKLFKGHVMSARDVAQIGYRGFMKGKTIVIPGMKNRLLVRSVRFAPRKIVTKIVRKIQEKSVGSSSD